MKQIKIVLSLIVVLSFTGNAIGQHIGIQAGGLLSNIKWRNELYTVNTFTKAGAMGGITLDIPLKNDMVFNTALNYKYMGTVIKDSSALGSMRFGFINLDLTYCYLFDMKTFQIYIEGGGYVGYMVNASRVDKPEGEDEEVTDLEIGTSSDDQIKPWDMGLSIGGGVYLNKWKFGVGYQPGIVNLSTEDDVILRTKAGYLRAAYFFNRAPKEKAAQ